MIAIDARGTLSQNGTIEGASPFVGCGSTSNPCTPNLVVQSDGTPVACSVCNGTWTVTGYFFYDFPFVPGASIVGSNCQEVGLDQQECTLSASTIL